MPDPRRYRATDWIASLNPNDDALGPVDPLGPVPQQWGPAQAWQATSMGGASSGSNQDALGGVLDVAGKLWTLPNTLLGLLYAGAGMLAGTLIGTNPEVRFGNNAIEFLHNPLNLSAVTLGNTINYGVDYDPRRRETPLHNVGDHERQHTYQAQLLGPLYLPAALLSLALGTLVNGDSHGPASFMERGPQDDPPRPW